MSASRIEIHIFTEDAAATAHAACSSAVKHALQCVDPDTQTHRVRFLPNDRPEAREAMIAHKWRGSEQAARNLVQRIATLLLQHGDSLVVFHHDGDVPWADRPSPTTAQFEAIVVSRVRTLLGQHPSQRAEAIARLVSMVPHRSLEAWAYQNLHRARALTEHDGDLRKLTTWEADRSLLDELDRPEHELTLASKHNADLLRAGWPREEVYAVGKSFAAFVDRLSADQGLRRALAATHAPEPEDLGSPAPASTSETPS